jgi:hypothetical protein
MTRITPSFLDKLGAAGKKDDENQTRLCKNRLYIEYSFPETFLWMLVVCK